MNLLTNATEPINIIVWDKTENKFSYFTDNEKINFYKENYWSITNINKPLKEYYRLYSGRINRHSYQIRYSRYQEKNEKGNL